ncbi:hypothetical protein ACIBH1_45520 [Nonomuraea sp. NPDC050663]|uniref:hypothetical protein n=1 Tax=Nonomuraea sp. NPDC050663 TaxID=3364370 RepID=UPI0037A7DA6D
MRFEDLGISPPAENVYRYLNDRGPTPLAILAEEFGPVAINAVEELRSIGLTIGDPPDARRPDHAFARLLAERAHQLNVAQLAVAEMQERYIASHRETSPPVIAISSREQATACRDELTLSARTEILQFITWPFHPSHAHPADDERRMEADGQVRAPHQRLIYERRVLAESAAALDGMRKALNLPGGASVRVIDFLPYKLVIRDGVAALSSRYPRGHEDQVSALHIAEHNVLVTAHMMTFEYYWERSTPLGGHRSRHVQLSDEELKLLGMLVNGETQDFMARALGVQAKTVYNRITKLCKLAGIKGNNPIKLAVHVTKNGWLD